MMPLTMACHYHPPCPDPARVLGSLEHTDPSLFTVLAQDSIGGLVMRLGDGGAWVNVPPVPGALVVFVGDVLKVPTALLSGFAHLHSFTHIHELCTDGFKR
jgi:isopenicillin N synthase-like dioxygenase